MSRLFCGVSVFQYFAEFDYGISPSKNIVGQIQSIGDFYTLIPAPSTRVEIERAPGEEEIRVVKDENGDYHVTANASVAQNILKDIDQQTTDLYQLDIKAYPDGFPDIKSEDFHRDIIRYDEDGDRILPGIKRAGYISTVEEFNVKETDSSVCFLDKDFVGVENTKTGEVWWATEGLKKEMLERQSKQDEMDDKDVEDDEDHVHDGRE
jgi:hypothetical protein